MKQFEYQTSIIYSKAYGEFDREEIDRRLNRFGQQGWELVEAVASARDRGTVCLICMFKRERAEQGG